jgi:hypothetical protein
MSSRVGDFADSRNAFSHGASRMTQILRVVALLGAGAYLLLRFGSRFFERGGIEITLRLDRSSPGAHLIWHIGNTSQQPITLTKLIVHTPQGATDMLARGLPKALASQGHVVVATDVDWTLLAARSIAVTDSAGREHAASRRQLIEIQERLRQLIDRRVYTASARDFLTGAADLAFGVVILGLGFFMLMWVIATG